MRILKLILAFFIYIISYAQAYSQSEVVIWYFGYNAGIKFTDGSPEALTDTGIQATEGCSVVSNFKGEIILYTDGVNVYNRNHQVIQNGTDLLGDHSSTQSAVIVPVPEDPDIYYVFTVGNLDVGEPNTGFRYSLVDMNLNGGFGGVLQDEKNIKLLSPSAERLTAVRHHDNESIWVIAQEWNSDSFYSYLVTSAGLDINNVVISDVGYYNWGNYKNGKGYMMVSSDGTMLGVAIQGEDLVELFGFCDSTGVVSDLVADLPAGIGPYGIEFSEDSHYLYSTERDGHNVYQWDLEAGSEQNIIDSRIVVGELATSKGGAMKMGTDGRIYIARQGKKYLSVINEPSNAGLACDFQEVGISLIGDYVLSQEGLPSFFFGYYYNLQLNTQNQCRYDTIYFSLNDSVYIDSVYWDFGDPASGVFNNSSLFSPTHIYKDTGTYNVKVVISYLEKYIATANKSIRIFDVAKVDLGNDTTICYGDSIELYTNNDTGYVFKWMDDQTLNKRRLTVSKEGLYWVEGQNFCNVDYDSVYIYVRQLPEVDLGEDTAIGYNSQVFLDAGYWNGSYLWQDGSSDEYYTVEQPGTYWVEVTDDIGCKSADTVLVKAIPFQIYFPTAFTPNNDDVNDLFIPRTTYDIKFEYELRIFNRWGEEVFKTDDINRGWDGTYNGIICPAEVYVWYIEILIPKNNEFFKGPVQMTGNVTLIR